MSKSGTTFYTTVGLAFIGFLLTGMVIFKTRAALLVVEGANGLHETDRTVASDNPNHQTKPQRVVFPMGELLVNVGAAVEPHYLRAEIDLELFDERSREILSGKKGAIKHTIIQAIHEQDFDSLQTLGGKLYFKELLTARLNRFVNHPAVRQIHFTSFFLQ